MGQNARLARLFADGRAKSVLASCLAFLGVLALPDAYIDTHLFLYPAMRGLANSGMAPKVDPRLQIVLYDDASRQALRREPSFADWGDVTAVLARTGLKQAFVLDPYTMDPGETPQAVPGVELFLPVVITNDAANTMSVDPALYADRLIAKVPEEDGSGRRATAVIGPKPAFLRAVAAIGHLNLFEDNSTFVTYETATTRIPHLGFYAGTPPDAWKDVAEKWEKRSRDGRVFAFLPKMSELVADALPLRWFYGPGDYGDLKPLDGKRRQRLEGKTIAVFANAAYTGSRFMYSPQGLVLSALVTAGLINNVLTGTLVVQPVSSLAALGVALLLIAFSLLTRRHRFAGILLTAVALAGVLISFGALASSQIFLPALSFGIPVFCAGVGRLYAWAIESYLQKNLLQDQIGLGETIQALFMPEEKRGRTASWSYEFLHRPHGPMSGDWIRIFKGDRGGEEVLVVAVGDVVGKGPSAALITALIAGSLDRYERDGKNPDAVEIATLLSDDISSTFDTQQYSTLLLAVCRGSHVQLVRCGSYDWCTYDPDLRQAVRLNMPSNPPVGLSPGHRIRAFEFTVDKPWTTLFAFTDGVLDSNVAFRKAIDRLKEVPPPDDREALFAFLAGELFQVGKAGVLPDDQTIVALTRI